MNDLSTGPCLSVEASTCVPNPSACMIDTILHDYAQHVFSLTRRALEPKLGLPRRPHLSN